MDSETSYRVDTGNVVHETIEGEVIVIHLLNGSYYSLGGGGPEIWEHLLRGASAGQIAATIPSDGATESDVSAAVREFMESLAGDGLIVAEPSTNGHGPPERAPGAWVPPVFERYTDMKDYFLLDPIHEVDATGWPNRQGS